MLQEDKFIYS